MHLRRCAVDFIRKHDVGEHRALLDGKLAGSRVVNLRADHVRRQQVRRELNAVKLQLQRPRDGADRERLRQPRHAFKQNVAVGEEADEQPVDEPTLADEDTFDRLVKGIEFQA